MKPKDITYCYKCKEYFEGSLENENNFPICPNCNGMGIIRIFYEGKNFWVEEDTYTFGFCDYRDYKSTIKIVNKLVEKSRK